ncbi:MAG: peptide-methionine (S)-S-oxide reductase MsrA [Candidatus Omnitrophica bacterium]|nr:peptide-methionine (S)-S-oxide reductase MsrA [Candidatus Omnitrophota bacterium]
MVPQHLEVATFALGCFWSPEAMFGSIEGVVRTRVGYSGGVITDPTYHNLGNHSETLQIEYDPEKITFKQLLAIFWKHHDPAKEPWSQQYKPIIFFHNELQQELAGASKQAKERQLNTTVYTEILPFKKFYLAEDYHQKYRLRHEPDLMRGFTLIYPDMKDFVNSTAASRINGYLSGYGTLAELEAEISQFGLSDEHKKRLLSIVKDLETQGQTRKKYCPF